MGSATKFAALNTKIQGMSGKLLKNRDYEQMINLNTVKEVLQYLKESTYYGEFIFETGGDRGTIEQFEIESRKHLMALNEKLICYTQGVYKEIIMLSFMRSEVEDLKVYLRHFVRGANRANISNIFVAKGKRSSLDYELLNESVSLEDFIDKLKGTRYHKILKLYINEEPKKILFYMEMNLDRIYFKAWSDSMMKLKGDEKEYLMLTIGRNIDFLNIQWIYRGLKYYDLSPEELLNYTLEHGYYFKYKSLKDLCYSESSEEVIRKIGKSKYGEMFDYEKGLERFLEIEMERLVYNTTKAMDKKSNLNILKAVGFIHEVEFEMRDIFTIVEAKRYQLTKEEIKKYLVREIA